jgi:hypothetical protein
MFFADDDIVFQTQLPNFHRMIDRKLENTGSLNTIFLLQCLVMPNIDTDQFHKIKASNFSLIVWGMHDLTPLSLHFLHGDEFKFQGTEPGHNSIHDLGHPRAMSMSIVQDDHRARDGSIHDLVDRPADRLHPMRRDAAPHHQTKSPFREATKCPCVENPIWRAQVADGCRGKTGSACNGNLGANQSCTQRQWVLQWKRGMPVAVQGKLMTALMDMVDQIWVALGAFPDQVECGTHLVSLQNLQQARRITRVRTVVKGQRDSAACSFPKIEDVRVPALCGTIGLEKESV